MSDDRRNLWLVGMMGAGKTEVGRTVAETLDRPFRDTDEAIVSRLDESVEDIWSARGEEAFRDLESEEVAAASRGEGTVVATGGGVVLREGNVAAMRGSGLVVWLDAPLETLLDRLGEGRGRPLLGGDDVAALVAAIADARAERYAAAADIRIDTGARSLESVVGEVIAAWIDS